jgi:hypothetical protein
MKTITVPDSTDRKKLKSKFFYISNSFKSADGVIIYIECKPFSNKKADKVIIFSNSVKIYKNGVPIDEVKNTATDSNSELINIIEDRI